VLLEFVALERLLVLKLLLCVLVPLQKLVVLRLTQLQLLIHPAFKLLTQRVHLILLFLHQLGLCSKNLLVSLVHILLALLLFDLVGALLDLMRLLVVLLLGQVCLNFTKVE
jgi:hypothetical protein